jgi:xylulose-5-phosphate/fructose-6-phosphate phosphoketolase
MIVLRTPKGWTGPKEVDGRKVEGFWRAHQVPWPACTTTGAPEAARGLAEELQARGAVRRERQLIPELKALAPKGTLRMSANPHANGGLLRRAAAHARLPGLCPGGAQAGPGKRAMNTKPLGELLRDVMAKNMDNFRVFGPDENTSNKLDAIYEVSKKLWLCDYKPEDADGGELSPDGRVLEMLSEHTLEGWYEGYVLTGRHGFFATYEAFVHVIDSMYNQHAKWLAICEEIPWRARISSINLLITSTVWRQDHNGFTHQDPGFLDVVVNKNPEVTRIYLPPDVNTLLSTVDHCLQSRDDINVIVCDKQNAPPVPGHGRRHQALHQGCRHLGLGEQRPGREPDVVMVGCGDIPTKEALAATALLREHFPDSRSASSTWWTCSACPRGRAPPRLSDRDFDSLFTKDKPIIFNFHGYPWLIHRLAYRRTNHANLHVRGYKEKGNINTPLELAIENEIDRFSLAIDVINRVPRLQVAGAHVKEKLRDMQIDCRNYAFEHGIDKPEYDDWVWPY